jgi:hypothetical protein
MNDNHVLRLQQGEFSFHLCGVPVLSGLYRSIDTPVFLRLSFPFDMTSSSTGVVLHEGSCHCGAVKWTVRAPAVLNVFHCKFVSLPPLLLLSIQLFGVHEKAELPLHRCQRVLQTASGTRLHLGVPQSTLFQGADMLTTYTFNTGLAQHKFCKVCGVQSFYVPRSNPDSIGAVAHHHHYEEII